MVSETSDVQRFLATHPLFQHLTPNQIEFVSANIFIAFNKSGDQLNFYQTSQTGTKAGIVIVRSGSLEIRGQKALIDRLSSGDFIIPDVLFKENKDLQVYVLEDCLYYELTPFAFHSLNSSSDTFAELCRIYARTFLSSGGFEPSPLGHHQQSAFNEPYLNHFVHEYMSSPSFCAQPEISIREAARMMKHHNISSLLISDSDQLKGIVTDRDFRTRVLAGDLTGAEPVKSVMTPDPICIDGNKRLHEAQLKMMAKGIHHLPVTQGSSPIGIITMSDILRANNIEPLSLARSINHSTSVGDLTEAAKKLPDLVVKLIERDARATEVGEIITSFSDSLTRRLIKLAGNDLGPPPCDFSWLAFGSQARQEQMLGSDQDNGLLLPDDFDNRHSDYFREMAEFVNEGLDRCGMPRCPGGIMACNPKWRLPLSQWKGRFDSWITEPSPHALMHASIFFDMRHIAGQAELVRALQNHVLNLASKNTIFLAMMCENSLQHSPPLGFFKTFVLENDGDHNNTLELKKRGTIPIVDIARNYALSIGITSVNTTSRLHEIAQAGAMSKELAISLIDAHEFIAGIRLDAQGREYRAGKKIDNHLNPKELSPLVRHQLKEAFHLVREAQAAMKARFGGGVL